MARIFWLVVIILAISQPKVYPPTSEGRQEFAKNYLYNMSEEDREEFLNTYFKVNEHAEER